MCDMSAETGPQLSTGGTSEEGGRVVDVDAKVEAVFGLRGEGSGEPEIACEGVSVSGLPMIGRCESCGWMDRLHQVEGMGETFRICNDCMQEEEATQ